MFHKLEQMLKNAFDKSHFARWFPIYIAGSVALALFPLTFSSSDLTAIFYACVTVPLVCLCLCILALKSRRTQRTATVATLAVFLVFTGMLLTHFLVIRDAVRWFAYGRILKYEVLKQPKPMDSSLSATLNGKDGVSLETTPPCTSCLTPKTRWQMQRKCGLVANLAIYLARSIASGSEKASGTRCSFTRKLIGIAAGM